MGEFEIRRVTEELAREEWGKWQPAGLVCLAPVEEEQNEVLDVYTFPFIPYDEKRQAAWNDCTEFLRHVDKAMRFTAFTRDTWVRCERYLHLSKNGRKEGFCYGVQVVR